MSTYPRVRWSALRSRDDAPDHSDEGLGVFVPGLMGAGILLSAAILISDGVRHMLPGRGVRRRLNVVRGVRRIVVDLAEAAGMEIEERNLVRREHRRPWPYLISMSISLPLAAIVGRWGFTAFSSAGSSLEGNAIAIVYGLLAATALGFVGLASLVLILFGANPPFPARWLVAHTVFGRLSLPPDGVVERARLLIPNLDKGAGS